jgi:integrase
MRKTTLKIRKTKVRGAYCWEVTVPQQNGGRARRYFTERSEAETFLQLAKIQARNHGTAALSISERLRMEAVAGAEKLAPFGKSISDAVAFYLRHLEQTARSRPVAEVVEELLKSRKADGVSRRYREDLKSRLGRFCDTFGESLIGELDAPPIDSWLRSLGVGTVTRNTFRRRLSTLFEFARTQRWCAINPVAEVPKAREKEVPVGILLPEELARLLENAAEETLPYWVIGSFAGLRSAELERLEWEDIHFESALIEVKAAKAKSAARRFVKMEPVLRAWLAPYEGRKGQLCPLGLRTKLEADRQRAGLKEWKSNALRHSFASYHLQRFQDAGRLALEMGHRDQRLLFSHYRELVRPAAAQRYWSIMPPLVGGNIVALEVAS